MEQLKGSQRKYLRSQAHHLKPLVLIGRNGINQQVIGSVDLALKDHELIKVKFGEFKDAKKEMSDRNRASHKKRGYRHHRQHCDFLPAACPTGKKKN